MIQAPRATRGRMAYRWWMALILGSAAAILPRWAFAVVTPEQVDAAVDKAVKFLLDQQKNSNWEPGPRPTSIGEGYMKEGGFRWGGETAIATYALLAADEKWDSPPLRTAIAFLAKENLHGTYAVGLRSQVWNSRGNCSAPPPARPGSTACSRPRRPNWPG